LSARLHPDHVAQSFLQLQLRSVAPLLRRTQAGSQLVTPPPMQPAQIVKLRTQLVTGGWYVCCVASMLWGNLFFFDSDEFDCCRAFALLCHFAFALLCHLAYKLTQFDRLGLRKCTEICLLLSMTPLTRVTEKISRI
jgi:hypothetical protein